MSPRVGVTLSGRYRLQRLIATGGMGQVWEAVDAKSRKRVAIKVIVPDMATDPGQRKLLEHELKVAKSLDHPTVIKIDRLSEEGGLPHLVMELYPHANLKKQTAYSGNNPRKRIVESARLTNKLAISEANGEDLWKTWWLQLVKPSF
jgi:serine/threonine-protein kinase